MLRLEGAIEMSTSGLLYGQRNPQRLNQAGDQRRAHQRRDHERQVRERLRRRKADFADRGWRRVSSSYFDGDGQRLCWTTERYGDRFVSFTMKPTGPGSRSGAGTMRVLHSSVQFHARRKDAKNRATQLAST